MVGFANDRDHYRGQKEREDQKQARARLHQIPVRNVCAKAYWQFAITCVMKNNRQKTKSTSWNEYHMSPERKLSYFKVYKVIL